MQTLDSALDAGAKRTSPLKSCFQTVDPDVAAYLHARAYRLLRVDRLGESTIFTFTPEAALGAEAFYLGASVSAKLLLYAARRLEAMRDNKQNEFYSA